MKTLISIGAVAASLLVVTPAMAQRPGYSQSSQSAAEARFEQAQQRFDREYQLYQQEVRRYQQSRRGGNWQSSNDPRYNDPRYRDPRWDDRDEGDYDPARYYRAGPNYQERVLGPEDRVYRGRDGKYYCKRNDGTTGLIVGAVAGGVLGNVIDGGHSRGVGTILGVILGGAVGQQVDANNQQVRCR